MRASTDRLLEVLGTAGRLLDEAAEHLPATLCRRTHAYLREYREGLAGLGARIRRSRLALLG